MKFLVSIQLLTLGFSLIVASNSLLASSPQEDAAIKAANTEPACLRIQPFYWEIGKKDAVLVSGKTGDGEVSRDSEFDVASSSKWVFAAYVLEKNKGLVDAIMSKFLKLSAGYTSMPTFSCVLKPTVQACFNHKQNSEYNPKADDKFFYNGGHYQKWAVDHGLGSFGRIELAEEYKKVLGNDIPFRFRMVQLAGGLRMSAGGYGLFLQKILRGELKIHDHLGEDPVCTSSKVCPKKAMFSPLPRPWHYSFGHWIEDDEEGDGSFSSEGAFGFYPWIDKTKTYYGIISRHTIVHGSGYQSANCGMKIRQAFLKPN